MRRLMTLMTLSLIAACNESDLPTLSDAARRGVANSPSTNLAGTYKLLSVNSATLPILVRPGDPRVELISEQLVVNPGGTFAIATNRRNTGADGAATMVTMTDAGTYSTSGTSGPTATFQFNTGNTVAATLSGNTLTLVAPNGSVAVYTR
jgi:hypothetical protein